MLIANPNEDDIQGRKRCFTMKCKRELTTKIESCRTFSASSDEAASNWKKQLDHVPNSAVSNLRKMRSGRPGLLAPIDDFLLGGCSSFVSREW